MFLWAIIERLKKKTEVGETVAKYEIRGTIETDADLLTMIGKDRSILSMITVSIGATDHVIKDVHIIKVEE
jgi:hypothetical protein